MRHLIAGVAWRPIYLLALLCATYAYSSGPSPLDGVWKGTLGTQPITACYSSAEYGFYYYDKYATPIKLSHYFAMGIPTANATQLSFKEMLPGQAENQAAGIWAIGATGPDRLAAVWSSNGKVLPIRLTRVRNSQDCGDKIFVDGIRFPVAINKTDSSSGIHYQQLSYMSAEEFRNGSYGLQMRLLGTDKITAKINAELKSTMPNSPTYCETGDGKDGEVEEYSGNGELEPVFLTENWLYIRWIFAPGSCGTAQFPQRGNTLWNRKTGDEFTNLWTWFGANRNTTARQLNAIIALHTDSDAGGKIESEMDVEACNSTRRLDATAVISMDTEGFLFMMDSSSMAPCTIHVSFDEVIPMLNGRGKTNLASIRADLARNH